MKRFLLRSVIFPIAKEYDLNRVIAKKLHINSNNIVDLTIVRKSLDARKRNNLKFNFTVELSFAHKPPVHNDLIPLGEPKNVVLPSYSLYDSQPVIIGAGPSGLFCALSMVEKGLKPIIYDRGETIADRKQKIKNFWKNGKLDENSNIQFGEGGAGTFSDGKLTARNRDIFSTKVFELFVRFGANSEIMYEALPHLGTDRLEIIITKIREYLEQNGCTFHWNSKLTDIEVEDNRIKSITINEEKISPEIVVLGIGNAARDIFRMLPGKNIDIESKDFAIGVRIEHDQDYINSTFYGENTDIDITGPANYRLTRKVNGLGVYTFCMCPGGLVINSSSEQNTIVTNGMSNSSRTGKYGNSALVVSVKSNAKDILSGVKLQERIEKKAFIGNYSAPVQSALSYLKHKKDSKPVTGSFLPSVHNANLHDLFPKSISAPLHQALKHWDKQYKGFAEKGVLIAPETRTSSPIRIVRDYQTRASTSVTNLFPIGEGSGYAGGIISSATDGWKTGAIFELKR